MSKTEAQGSKQIIPSNNTRLIQPNQSTATNESYGDKFQEHLMEQYKICVEMADRVSVRRGAASNFYISLLSALLALLSLVVEKNFFSGSKSILLLFTSILGLALCIAWYTNIQSYRQLNSLKFQVINEMEQYLPFRCFSREWQILKERRESSKRYTRLTTIEKFIPLIFATPYIGLLIYSFLSFIMIAK